jgi:two-component system NarL family sensor kinase
LSAVGESAAEETFLVGLVELLCAPTERPRWLGEVGRLLAEHLQADGCIAYAVDRSAGELVAVAGQPGGALVAALPPLRLPVGFGVTGRVAADGIPTVLVDDQPRNLAHRELMGLAPGQAVSRLCLPALDPDGRTRAVLAVHVRRTRRFEPAEVSVGMSVARLVGLRLQRDDAVAQVAEHRNVLDGLVAATVSAQEAERRRVAADLHDGVTQVIASLAFHLSAAEIAMESSSSAFAVDQVRAARRLADLAVVEARNAVSGLRSPVLDDLGLAAGLESLGRSVPQLDVTVDASELELPDHVATALYRVAQECIQNVVKHAEATHIRVTLDQVGGNVSLTVSDNGRGFDPQRVPRVDDDPDGHRYGMVGMHERIQLLGGRLVVESEPGAGTTVRAAIPLDAPRA